MAQLDPDLARIIPANDKPDLWDTILLAKQFWEKSEKAAPNTALDRTLKVFCHATLVLHGNLEVALERIAALEAKQKNMASTITRLVMDPADE